MTFAHILLWLAVLANRHFNGVKYYAEPDWNLFPLGTVWYFGYGLVNLPIHYLYRPVNEFCFSHFRGRIYDIQLSTTEVAINYAFHLVGFLLWWYLLGAAATVAFTKLRARLGK
jgi:hypothetical protein